MRLRRPDRVVTDEAVDASETAPGTDAAEAETESADTTGSLVDDTALEIEEEQLDAMLDQHPELAIGIPVFVAAMVYAVITYVRQGSVDLLESAIFAVVFGLVWVFFRTYFGE